MTMQSSPGEIKPKRSIAKVLGINGGILCSLAILAAPAADGCAPAADWCAVKPIVAPANQGGTQTVCGNCHGVFQTPSFATYAAVTANSPTFPTQKVWERMRVRVEQGSMPPPGTTFTQAQRDTLNAWFAAGAPGPATPGACQ
jgi:hypothetical protein